MDKWFPLHKITFLLPSRPAQVERAPSVKHLFDSLVRIPGRLKLFVFVVTI